MARLLEGWYQLTAPAVPAPGASLRRRERARRGRVASSILLGLIVIWLFSLPSDLASHYGTPSLIVFAVGLLILFGVTFVNRRGLVTVVAMFLVIAIDGGFLAIQFSTAATSSAEARAGSFPILIFSEVIAAALLVPAGVFAIAALNCVVVATAIVIWPAGVRAALLSGGSPNDVYNIFVGPPATQLIVAIALFLLTSSILRALTRAEAAEQMAERQRGVEEAERQELQSGVEQMRAALVALGNGNFHVRVARVKHELLWQVGSSLNNFITRLEKLEYSGYMLQREAQEAQRLVFALQQQRAGLQPVWPAPTGLPLDPVVMLLSQPAQGAHFGGGMGGGMVADQPPSPGDWAPPPQPGDGGGDLSTAPAPHWLFAPPAAPSGAAGNGPVPGNGALPGSADGWTPPNNPWPNDDQGWR